MLCWVEDILAPYISLVPPGTVPLILLNLYKYRIMALVMSVIQDLECKVNCIPCGCTGLVQPLDVGCPVQQFQKLHQVQARCLH
jgi:hypothetical protein